MQDIIFGSRVRSVRIRMGLRQVDVAARAGVSDVTVSRIERGHLDSVTVSALRTVASALEIRVDIVPRWRGGDLDRLINGRHAHLAELFVQRLHLLPGWEVRPEVSFSIFGERGIIDLLAWHEAERALLVIELKTEIVDVGELLGTLDRKVRLARGIAADLGWRADIVSACLVVAGTRTNRRRTEAVSSVLRSALPQDGRQFGVWLRRPFGRLRAMIFVPNRHQDELGTSLATPRRVSRRRRPGIRAPGARGRPSLSTK